MTIGGSMLDQSRRKLRHKLRGSVNNSSGKVLIEVPNRSSACRCSSPNTPAGHCCRCPDSRSTRSPGQALTSSSSREPRRVNCSSCSIEESRLIKAWVNPGYPAYRDSSLMPGSCASASTTAISLSRISLNSRRCTVGKRFTNPASGSLSIRSASSFNARTWEKSASRTGKSPTEPKSRQAKGS